MSLRQTLRGLLALAAVALVSLPALSWAGPPAYIPGQIIVKFKPGTTSSQRSLLRAQLGGPRLRDFKFINAELVRISGMSVEKAIALAKRNAQVAYAEPDFEVKADVIPNDTRFNELYAMRNTGQTGGTPGADIHATNAWDVSTGNPNTLVGVIDTGIDYTHPDLAANAWTNPGEIPGNSIDDDNNGYVDDVHGYDFSNNDSDPFDDNGHGSHCSGTIGGVGNNGLGVTGVNWTVKIAGIKFLNSGGSGSTAGAISSVQYAVAIHCKLTSNSWGGGGFSQALLDAINAASADNQLFIAAAGNAGSNNDVTDFFPANYASPAIISVAATDHNDALASFSNFGATKVHLGAPGVDILSCQPGGGYQLLSGTSMATPHVSGVAALIYGRFPAITAATVKFRILNFVDLKPSLTGKCVTGGRLNALLAVADADTTDPGAVSDLAASNPGSTTVDLSWTAAGDDGSIGTASRTELRYSTAPMNEGNFASGTLVPTPNPTAPGSTQSTTATGLAFSTLYYFAIKTFDEFDNASAISNVPTETTLGEPDISTTSLSQVDLLTGQTADRTLTISNVGQGRLDFTLPNPTLLFKGEVVDDRVYNTRPMGKNEFDPRHGEPVLDGQGGPDAAGYRWIDSDEAGGPTFSWVDISGVGTSAGFTGDDQNVGPFNIGFSFPFYGNNFSTVRLCSNGWLSFTATTTEYSNQPLPNATSAPANMVAPLWDDLNFTTGGQCFFYNDGSRFIVQWNNAPHYTGDGSSPGPYTFEAILYPSGKIVYQYLAINAPDNSNTIGIQDAPRTTGLQTVYNAAYVHNNLAIQIATLPQWCTVSPGSGSVLAGQSTDVTVHYNAAGLTGGIYNASVRIISNDPQSPTNVPAVLHVVGAPDVAAAPAATNFGLVFIGFPQNRTLVVSNAGTDVLNVTNIVSSDGNLAAGPTNFSLNPSASQNVTLTYNPAAPGALNATLTVQSNDPDQPSLVVAATGSANDAPNIEGYQTSMGARMQTNSSETQVLHVNNLNPITGATLNLALTPSVAKASASVRPPQPSLDLPKGAVDPRPGEGPSLTAAGGPDAFGHRWKDSNEAGGPTFSWVEISGVGTPINSFTPTRDDGNAASIPIGFLFPFYTGSSSTVNVCTNGWLSTTSLLTTYVNTTLPTATGNPENLIAPFWDDLDLRVTGQVYYYNDGSRFIVEWKDCPHYTSGGPYTFEAILYPSGKIVYQYLTMASLTNSATLGIQNATRTDALQMVFNANYVTDNLAVQISKTPDWLSVAPGNAAISGHGSVDLDVTWNSTGMAPGTYLGNLHVVSNDPDTGVLDIPVTLQVIDATDAEQMPVAFGLSLVGSNPARGSARFMMALPKSESVDLQVYNVRGEVVRHLASDVRAAGFHPVGWDGRDQRGSTVSSGVYFVRLRAGEYDKTVRVTMMK